MKESHQAYGRARERLIAAQAEITAAQEEMQAAEAEVRPALDAAWDANHRAVQDAVAAGQDAVAAFAEMEGRIGAVAQARWAEAGGVGLVVLTDDEKAQLQEAQAAIGAAREAHEAAKETFKDGVTVEQLERAADAL